MAEARGVGALRQTVTGALAVALVLAWTVLVGPNPARALDGRRRRGRGLRRRRQPNTVVVAAGPNNQSYGPPNLLYTVTP
jgi:hypothetical protein